MKVIKWFPVVVGILEIPLFALAPARANTVSVSQTVIITARVEDKRSIVVNDSGQMTKIYSNTAKDVAPQVYLYDVPGKQMPLTTELKKQYDDIIAQQKFLIGVEIPVAAPLADQAQTRNFLTGFVSSLVRPFSY